MYIGVYVCGGIIDSVIVGDTVEEVRTDLMDICPEEDFDQEADDMRIFNDANEEIESIYED